MKKNKYDVYAIVFVVLVLISLFQYGKWRDNYINSDFVFLLAKVYKIESNSDCINFCFYYRYHGIQYKPCISTFNIYSQDSLILLKVSRKNPEIFSNTNIEIPKCVLLNPNLDESWESLPIRNCN